MRAGVVSVRKNFRRSNERCRARHRHLRAFSALISYTSGAVCAKGLPQRISRSRTMQARLSFPCTKRVLLVRTSAWDFIRLVRFGGPGCYSRVSEVSISLAA
jgi:hypothetical protein